MQAEKPSSSLGTMVGVGHEEFDRAPVSIWTTQNGLVFFLVFFFFGGGCIGELGVGMRAGMGSLGGEYDQGA